MEKLRDLHAQWSHARALVVQAAAQLAKDFTDRAAQMELRSALKAERKARCAFEEAMKADPPSEDCGGRHVGGGHWQ